MNRNRDIQATHQILEIFENAHEKSEQILDNLTGIFCIVDFQGRIYRGNKGLAGIMGIDQESLLGKTFRPLCSESSWSLFLRQLSNIKGKEESLVIEFEMSLDALASAPSYIWHLRSFRHDRKEDGMLVTVIGSDVTDLKLVTNQKARMQGELATAKVLQETILPEKNFSAKSISIAGSYMSASECGGDLWYYQHLDERIFVCIADVTGHGVSAALIACAARAVLSVDNFLDQNSPAQILSVLNKVIWELARGKTCMTALLGFLDIASGAFCFANAAHDSFVIIPAGFSAGPKELCHSVSETSPMLGANLESVFGESKIVIKAQERMFFFTDGFYDVCDDKGSALGWRKALGLLLETIQENPSCAGVVQGLKSKIEALAEKNELIDDVTFFLVERAV